MATSIRLDSAALRGLLEASPEFKFELQRAVIAEVIRGMYRNDVPEAFLKVIDGLFPNERQAFVDNLKQDHVITTFIKKAFNDIQVKTKDHWGRETASGLNDQTKLWIKGMVLETMGKLVEDTIKTNAEAVIAKMGVTLDQRIERRVDRLLDDEVNKRVQARLVAAFAMAKQ